MSETCQKLAFTHPIVVLKSGLKNNWMKKLDRVNRPLHCDCKPERTGMACVSLWMSAKETSINEKTLFLQRQRLIRRCSNC